MSRILLCGLCPLPFENTSRSFGPGIRTWQFARGLAAAGHDVRVVAMEIPGCYDGTPREAHETRDGVEIERLHEAAFNDPAQIRARIRSYAPDVLVGATIYGSRALVRVPTDLPLWADQFGHVMAEAQAKAALDRRNDVLPYFWSMVKPVGLRADRFSTVSERQRFALIGELGALGRLNSETCGYEFISVIPCAVAPELQGQPAGLGLRGSLYPEDAFVVLWSGSYNVWSDVETLFRGLELAMAEEPRIQFLSTGGAVPGHDEETYRRLQELISRSRFSRRFHLRGWVPAHEVPSYWAEADLGVLSELPIYEGILGSKNRVIQWIGRGLPILYNRVGDLGELLEREALGLTFEAGDGEGLAERILWASKNPEPLRKIAEGARCFTHRELSFERTAEPLSRWAGSPTLAPDRPALERGVSEPEGHSSAVHKVSRKLSEVRVVGQSRSLRSLWRRLSRVL